MIFFHFGEVFKIDLACTSLPIFAICYLTLVWDWIGQYFIIINGIGHWLRRTGEDDMMWLSSRGPSEAALRCGRSSSSFLVMTRGYYWTFVAVIPLPHTDTGLELARVPISDGCRGQCPDDAVSAGSPFLWVIHSKQHAHSRFDLCTLLDMNDGTLSPCCIVRVVR